MEFSKEIFLSQNHPLIPAVSIKVTNKIFLKYTTEPYLKYIFELFSTLSKKFSSPYKTSLYFRSIYYFLKVLYYNKNKISIANIDMMCLSCFFISLKTVENQKRVPKLDKLKQLYKDKYKDYKEEDIKKSEVMCLKLLDYNINIMTAYECIKYLIYHNNINNNAYTFDNKELIEKSKEALEDLIKNDIKNFIFRPPMGIAEECIEKSGGDEMLGYFDKICKIKTDKLIIRKRLMSVNKFSESNVMNKISNFNSLRKNSLIKKSRYLESCSTASSSGFHNNNNNNNLNNTLQNIITANDSIINNNNKSTTISNYTGNNERISRFSSSKQKNRRMGSMIRVNKFSKKLTTNNMKNFTGLNSFNTLSTNKSFSHREKKNSCKVDPNSSKKDCINSSNINSNSNSKNFSANKSNLDRITVCSSSLFVSNFNNNKENVPKQEIIQEKEENKNKTKRLLAASLFKRKNHNFNQNSNPQFKSNQKNFIANSDNKNKISSSKLLKSNIINNKVSKINVSKRISFNRNNFESKDIIVRNRKNSDVIKNNINNNNVIKLNKLMKENNVHEEKMVIKKLNFNNSNYITGNNYKCESDRKYNRSNLGRCSLNFQESNKNIGKYLNGCDSKIKTHMKKVYINQVKTKG